jgi:hypothetical protein
MSGERAQGLPDGSPSRKIVGASVVQIVAGGRTPKDARE